MPALFIERKLIWRGTAAAGSGVITRFSYVVPTNQYAIVEYVYVYGTTNAALTVANAILYIYTTIGATTSEIARVTPFSADRSMCQIMSPFTLVAGEDISAYSINTSGSNFDGFITVYLREYTQ